MRPDMRRVPWQPQEAEKKEAAAATAAAAERAAAEAAAERKTAGEKAAADAAAAAGAAIQQVLTSAADGVPWSHCKLQVRGAGNVGKSSTIDAMSGKAFVAKRSTVGAVMQTCELKRRDLTLADSGQSLQEYKPRIGKGERPRVPPRIRCTHPHHHATFVTTRTTTQPL